MTQPNIYEAISEALALAGEEASCVVIGRDAWRELRADRRSMHCLTAVGERLYFKGIRIDPFAELVQPDSWELI